MNGFWATALRASDFIWASVFVLYRVLTLASWVY